MILLAQSGALTALIVAALGLITAMLLIRTYRNLRRQKQDDAAFVRALRPSRTDAGHHLDAPDEVTRWEVQMHETARKLSAQLDSKMGALQVLIAEADRAAARLETALMSSPDRSEPHPINQMATQRPSEASDRASSRDRREEIYTLSDYGYDAAEIARRIGSPADEVESILASRGRT